MLYSQSGYKRKFVTLSARKWCQYWSCHDIRLYRHYRWNLSS